MITLAEVQGILTHANPGLLPQANLLWKLVKIYIDNDRTCETHFRNFILEGIAKNLPVAGALPQQIRNTFIDHVEGFLSCLMVNEGKARREAQNLQLQGPPVLPQQSPPNPVAREQAMQLLRRLRTRESGNRGRELVKAARKMEGWFHWVNSGPVTQDLLTRSANAGTLYGPKERWAHSQKESGWEKHKPRKNDFAAWVNATGNKPDRHAHMNCWEAVMFSAYKADLVTLDWLRDVHREAALANQINDGRGAGHGAEHYGKVLIHALGYHDSVPFGPHVGLVPQEGDVVYWNRNEHVAIALGRRWVGGRAQDWLMSLWHNNNGTFSKLQKEDVRHWIFSSCRFRPCPF